MNAASAETPDSPEGAGTSPIGRALRVLAYVAAGGSTANLSELGRQLGINRVTAMRLLAALEDEGAIEALPHGGHRMGMGFLALAATALASDDLFGHGRRVLESLCAELALSAYLVVPEDGEAVYMARVMPEVALVSQIRIGSRLPLTLTTPGRAMLAAAPQWAEAAQAAAADPAALRQDLDSIRALGCAWSFSGYERGIDSCAAAVRGPGGTVLAALSVAGPDLRFGQEPGLRDRTEAAVKAAAAQLSRILGG